MRAQTVYALAEATTPRYCTGCGGHAFAERGISNAGRALAPAWRCADVRCGAITVITARAARRLRGLDRRPSFRHQHGRPTPA